MAGGKHLVLDDDVYLRLSRRKARTRLTMRTIGNSILRSMLSHRRLPDAIGERLIRMGKVSREEYARVLEESIKEVEKTPPRVAEIIRATDHRSFTSGS